MNKTFEAASRFVGLVYRALGILKAPSDTMGMIEKEADALMAQLVNVLPGWQPIEEAPSDGTVVDLWVDGERLCNMRRVVIGKSKKKNVYYTGVDAGGVVRNATHFMLVPKPPK